VSVATQQPINTERTESNPLKRASGEAVVLFVLANQSLTWPIRSYRTRLTLLLGSSLSSSSTQLPILMSYIIHTLFTFRDRAIPFPSKIVLHS
jgi:hypothetical protein